MVYIIPYFLFLHFGENFMKIQTKIPKMQMHENLHKNLHFYAIFREFLWWAIKATNMLQLTLLNFYMVLKWWSSSLRMHQVFPILMVQMLFSPNSTGL